MISRFYYQTPLINLIRNKQAKIITLIFLLTLTPIPQLLASTSIQDVEVGFSPGLTAEQVILLAIKEATKSIDIAAYSFTSKPIALAIINAQDRGISVRVIADKKSNSSNKHTAITYLINHHIHVKLNNKYTIMHNKFMIVDKFSVETGSFNYTKSAVFNNAENVIYLRNRPDIAEKYTLEFNRLWSEAVEVPDTH